MNNTAQDSNTSHIHQHIQSLANYIAMAAISAACTLWTIAANFLVLVCFYRSRRKSWTIVGRLSCSMCVSDLLVGIMWLAPLSDAELNGVLCPLSAYLVISFQCVSLFHVLGICVLRNMKLGRLHMEENLVQTRRHTTFIAFVSWTVPLIIISIPFLAWGKFNLKTTKCRTSIMFGDNVKNFTLYVSIFYITSQIITNVTYVMTAVRIRMRIRKFVAPAPIQPPQSSVQEEAGSNQTNSNSSSDRPDQDSGTQVQARATLRRQNQGIKTIGLLLLLFNVFTSPMPINGLIMRENISKNLESLYLANTMFILNCGLNPIVYATRIKILGEEVVKLYLDMLVFFHCLHQ